MMDVRDLKRKGLMLIIMISMVLALSATVFADEQCTIDVSPNLTGIEVTKGGREQVDLSSVFSDSLGHELSYTLDESEESLKARIKDGVLLIDPLEMGEFEIKITAKCELSGTEKQITIPVDIVESEDEGNPAQYGYDETPAEYATAIFTFSCDGVPLVGNDADNTVLAHLKVKVPYFDLGLYGLESYYRYHTKDGRGPYIDDEVVERPTAMHMMIYVTERYYLGLPEFKCCKGTSGVLEYSDPVTVRNMFGNKAYNSKHKAYEITGAATSTYMKYLWGHDENLMYYRNHFFPLMSPGWGSTSDYQLISDGDTFDIAMYSDWNFYSSGAFCCFDKEEYEVGSGEDLLFSSLQTSSAAFGSGELKPISGLKAEIYDDRWNKVATVDSDNAGFGYAFQEPGKYHIIGMDSSAGTDHANKSPATADVTVTDSFADYPFDSIVDQDNKLLPRIKIEEDIPDVQHYHVSVPDGTSEVKVNWPDLSDEVTVWYWDYDSGAPVQLRDSASIQDGVITFDPSVWKKGEKAALLCDGSGDPVGAFTFSFYTPEGVNFAPELKQGVKPVQKASWREKKDYVLNMSDFFVDRDGDQMTYTVSVDGKDPADIDSKYTFNTDLLGQHTLVFTPKDSKGKEGQTLTLELKITANQKPGLRDDNDTGREVSIRYDEKTELALADVFSDFDNDEIMYKISTDGGEYEDFDKNGTQKGILSYTPKGMEDIGEHIFRIKASDDLAEGNDVYVFKVNVTDDQAPVPVEEEITVNCMLNHYQVIDYTNMFTDPEGDALSYKISVNGGEQVVCQRYGHDTLWNVHRVLIDQDEKYTLTVYAMDTYGKTSFAKIYVYPTPEVMHEISVDDNVFDATENGDLVCDVHNGHPATLIHGYRISDNVTLRGVRYSEQDGDFNYYLDIDSLNVPEDETFDMTILSDPSGEGFYIAPNFGNKYNFDHEELKAQNGCTYVGAGWFSQKEEYDFLQVNTHTQWHRISVNMVDPGEPDLVKLMLEEQREGLYQGEPTDRSKLKAEYSDGVVRNINDFTLNVESFEESGKNMLTAEYAGIQVSKDVNVMEVPSYICLLNQEGKYARARLARVTDENGEPIEGAIVTVGDKRLNPLYSDDKYDDGGKSKLQRYSRDIEVILPMSVKADAVIHVELEMLKYKDYAHARFTYLNIYSDTEVPCVYDGDIMTGIQEIQLEHGRASTYIDWNDRKDSSGGYSFHAYDRFNIKVKTGTCAITGRLSSWDNKDNAELLVYPDNMSDEDVRADAMGEREHALNANMTVEDAVANENRYERSFKVEGLDAGKYKLAVVKPGKYVVNVSETEIDGTDDLGTISLRLFGDINSDGKLDVRDVTQIARYVVGKRQFTEEESLAADVNLDEKVDVKDITQISRKIVGKSSALDKIE